MKYILLLSIALLWGQAQAQSYLNDTVAYSPDFTMFQSVQEVDSGYFCVGMATHPQNALIDQYLLCFVDFNGNWSKILLDYDTLNNQRAGFSYNQLIRNNNNNFVHVYSNCGNGNCYPRVKEVSPQGTIIQDISFQPLIDSLHLLTLDGNNIYYHDQIDEYTILANVDDTSKSNNGLPASGGLLYIRTNANFDILDTISFFDPNEEFHYGFASLVLNDQNNKILMIQAVEQAAFIENSVNKALFYQVNNNGSWNLIGEFQNSDHDYLYLSHCMTEDNGYIFPYRKGRWGGSAWRYTNSLAKLDANLNLVWSVPVEDNQEHNGVQILSQYRLIKTSDHNYLLGGGGIIEHSTGQLGAQFTKFNAQGERLWQRKHFKVASIPDTMYSYTVIKDVIENSRGGFTAVGQFQYNGIIGQGDYYRGYIVETNCLGYRGNPEASFDYAIEDGFNVTFYNTSMQAGSYTWDFGDGTSLTTDEYADTITHTFTGFGNYEVQLIAHGCDGMADTISRLIQPAFHADPTVVTNGQGYFSVFPNPLSTGELLFIYLNNLHPSDANLSIAIYAENGDWVDTISIGNEEGTYEINHKLAQGSYLLTLYNGDQLLQTRKLIVQ